MSDLSLNKSSLNISQHRLTQAGQQPIDKLGSEPKPELSESQKREVFQNQQKLTNTETQIGQNQIDDLDQGLETTRPKQILNQSQRVPEPNMLQVERAQTLPILNAPVTKVALEDLKLGSEGMKRAKGDLEQAIVSGDLSGSAPEKLKGFLRQEFKHQLSKLSQIDNNIFLSDTDKTRQKNKVYAKTEAAIARLLNAQGRHDELSVLLKLLPKSELKDIMASFVGELREGKSLKFSELSDKKQSFINHVLSGFEKGVEGATGLELQPQQDGMRHTPTPLGERYQAYMSHLTGSLTQLPQGKLAQLKLMNDQQILDFFKPELGSSELLAPSLIEAVRKAQPVIQPRGKEPFVKPLTSQDLLGPGVSDALQALERKPGGPLERGSLLDGLRNHLQGLERDHNTLWKLSLMTGPELKELLKPIATLKDGDAEWLMKELHGMLPNRSSQETVKIDNFDVPRQLTLGDKTYVPRHTLGEAAFGVVVKYTNPQDENDHIAVKLLHGKYVPEGDTKLGTVRSEAIRELELHRELQGPAGHPGVIGLKGAIPGPDGMLCMVQEFAPGGTLFSLGDQLGKLVPPLSTEARQLLGLALLKQSLEAMGYLHEDREMLHEDMKSPNIMLGTDGIKLIDFGTSLVGNEHNRSSRQVDNPRYLAPEQLGSGTLRSNAKTEIWSMGTLAYEMMVGRLETHSFYNEQFVFKIENHLKDFLNDGSTRFMSHSNELEPSESRKPVHELIDKLMSPQPEDRPSAREALEMPVFKDPRLNSPEMKQILSRLSEPLPQGTPEDEQGSVRFGRVREDLEKLSMTLMV